MRTRTGTHESGHVIVGSGILGLPAPFAVVGWDRHSGHVARWQDELPLDDRGLRDLATCHLAGQAALLVFDEVDPGGGADYDRQMAEGICKLLAPTGANALYADL